MLNLLSFADVELTFGEAALYSVIGFVLIIVVLAVMALLIALLNYCLLYTSPSPRDTR